MSKHLPKSSALIPAPAAAIARAQTADRVIAKLRDAAQLLQDATTIHQAKVIADLAEAQRIFARRQELGDHVTAFAHEIKTHALAKLGELLTVMPKEHGARGIGKSGVPARNSTYSDLGLSKKTASVAQQLAALPAPTREAIAKQEISLTQACRDERRKGMTPAALPSGKYRVVYADPPWHYGNSGVINSTDGYGRAARHYPSMTIAELCELDVAAHVADDAVLFLWVTCPLLAECWPVIKAWGFAYKTLMVWDKVKHNYGHYVSVRAELLLICTRGSCLPDHATPMPDNVVTLPRSDVHSEKPEEFRALIDRLYDGGAEAKLELFGRKAVAGWTQHGNEIQAEVAYG